MSASDEERLRRAKVSACVLIGVDAYNHLPGLPAVQKNVARLGELLADTDIWGVPGTQITPVRNPESSGAVIDAILAAAERATDTLLVYYAGHGLLDIRSDQLYLALPGSQRGRREKALQYDTLRTYIEEQKHSVKRRIIVLDCCYSGQAANGSTLAADSDAPEESLIAIEGSYILTSTGSDLKAQAEGEGGFTAFSGELIRLLERGDPQHPDRGHLSLDQIHHTLRRSLIKKKFPEPRCHDDGSIGELPFVRNNLASPEPEPAPPRQRWGRRRLTTWGTLLTVTGAAAGVGGTLLWGPKAPEPHTTSPTAAVPGPCGKDSPATLLDVSDRLDQSPNDEYLGNKVDGLSALALTGTRDGVQQALAVRDDEPAQLFRISLGTPFDLRPEVTEVQGLYKADHSRFAEFDGEGLVVEKDGRTALVSSELGPAVRRFTVSDGKQTGPGIQVPAAFRPPPQGEAERTRSLESLAVTPDGGHLFAGMEGPLLQDDDVHGRHQVRIEHYKGSSGGAYTTAGQYAYQTDEGLYLSELVALDKDHLLALERGYISQLGNGIHVYEVDLSKADDVREDDSLGRDDADVLAPKKPLFNLGTCPSRGVRSDETQPNPVLTNVEGMALGPKLSGAYAGNRVLYLIADNNARPSQSTRVYSLAVRLG
ncbi:esterase-like activity of phytase family protein [Streptomyces sp. NPDC059009]|uniref:caspase, EACC1-associated type n=1 Tax=Streptomyces sp. NPDC059009 TaxID=3346694 RepID=UPI00367BD468